MFYNLLYPLVGHLSLLNILKYITVRSAYAAVTALLLAFLLGPWLIRKLKELKAGQSIRQDGPQSHLVKSGTPTMGGLLMLIGVTGAALLWMDLTSPVTWILMLALLGFGGLGLADDLLKVLARNSKGLNSTAKLAGQFIVALACMLWLYFLPGFQTGLYVPFLKNPVMDLGPAAIALGIFWMIGWSNAVNLTDGLDGLATGLVIFVGLALAVIAYVSGRVDYASYLQIPYNPWGGEIAVFCLALVGASVGFLWFNGHPAEVFMGDTGSLALGGVFGLVAVLLKKELLLVILGGVFVMETVSVIIQVFHYKRTKKRFFRMAPLHHHFELSGWAETKVVTRFWILGGMFAILGLSTLKLQ
ncbi:MAG: phospho-N-acetylmuramoyl-pentapeptide-transferase [Spirochaetales bacterium]